MTPHTYLLADKTVNPEWRKVDDYLEPLLCPTGVGEAQEAEAFQRTLESHGQKDIPAINVSPLQGMYLYNTALSIGIPRGSIKILEVGTLAGYSTLWLAKAAKEIGNNSKVITLEYAEKHARVARDNIASAGFGEDLVQVIVGDAKETINTLVDQGEQFDLIFIDADKPSYPEYWKATMKMVKKGSMIIGDNVVRQGRIADPANKDENVIGVRAFMDLAAKEPNVTTTVMSTVNGKGWDGFTVSVVH
ncbi:S-adenosyl-L-methionine-dependent methyltransferase [Cystobasidium minutum MCA 4210]|uniref:S-adenosyl-L-methionine-dependent methyltransferase n=1 Tax=Cystobasidium minutum MCA 4210 TaxID=1397322 RepID=UPI0034CE247A|eukprot:jgi/Rhomi1/95455/CE95454_1885